MCGLIRVKRPSGTPHIVYADASGWHTRRSRRTHSPFFPPRPSPPPHLSFCVALCCLPLFVLFFPPQDKIVLPEHEELSLLVTWYVLAPYRVYVFSLFSSFLACFFSLPFQRCCFCLLSFSLPASLSLSLSYFPFLHYPGKGDPEGRHQGAET